MLRARGSFKWTAPGPDGFGAAVAEMDFGAAPAILDAIAELSADAKFGYLPPYLAAELAAACAEFQKRRYGWDVDPEVIHHVPDVIKALEIAITRFSRPGSPVILPTPAYMPFLSVPGFVGREIIQVRMRDDGGFFTLDLDAIGSHVHDSTVPVGPTSTKSGASSAPVAGSHSIGGTMTSSPLRMPRIRRSVSALMNVPITGPSERV